MRIGFHRQVLFFRTGGGAFRAAVNDFPLLSRRNNKPVFVPSLNLRPCAGKVSADLWLKF